MTGPAQLRVWQGIETIDPPECRHDYAELLAMAQAMLASRQRRFPDLIRSGQIDSTAAQDELATFAAIVADWQWIVTGEGQPAPQDTLAARTAALDDSLATIAAIAREQEGFDDQLARQAQLVIAMRWHLEPGRQTHLLAALTHAARTRAATSLCPTCERRPGDPAIRACTRTDCGLPGNAPATSTERTAA